MAISDYIAYINTTQIHRVVVVLFIVLLGVGMGVGFSVASTNARKDADADYNRRLAIFSQWQMDLTSHFTKASSLAAATASFAFSTALVPANLTAPSVNRSKVLVNPEAYNRFCSQVFIPGVSLITLVPGGAMSQLYPPSYANPGLDMLNNAVYKHFFPTLMTVPGVLTGGPSKLATRPGFGIFVFFPIHVSNITNRSTFWGTSFVLIEITVLLGALNVSSIMASQGMDYAMWFTTDVNGTVPTVVTESDPAATMNVLNVGLRMRLPISEAGRQSYFAMHPKGGPISANMAATTAAIVAVATFLGAAAVILFIYFCAYLHFLYRHRRAPASHSTMYVAALALRGAQPIADRAPLVAVQMFNDFNSAVRKLALSHDCYPICEIGDRCVYVASKTPDNLLALGQAAVLEIAVQGSIPQQIDALSQTHTQNLARSRSVSHVSYARTATHVSKVLTNQISEEMTQSSFIGASICHPSVACHTMSAMSVYDAARDVYFFGSAAQLGKLCGALDLAKCGEVCWTDAFNSTCPTLCREAADSALSSHIISENDEIVLHVANWWRDTGDERDTEDPSTAMAVLSDAYVRKMTVIVSKGQLEAKEHRRKGADETKSGTSHRSFEATSLVRTATLLHISILNGDEKHALEIIQRTVTEERGTVISAFDSTVIAAFNLLSAGGHHQVRAADTVLRLREALPSTKFVCSISHGKVTALIIGDLVMCTGDAATRGRGLLKTAIALACPGTTSHGTDDVTYLTSDTEMSVVKKRFSSVVVDNGLCLLVGKDELSSTYDCEGVDVGSFCGKTRVVYRLALRKSGNKANGDEWMYRLRDDEDQSPFAIVNAVFEKIAGRDLEEAARIWKDYSSQVGTTADNCGMEISSHAKAAIARLLPTAAPNPKSKHVSPL
eukprot:GILI01003031.1.p1 GENE.GILI01003031.1~~GILI01003031.1.p1  ORF type:complete len:897 (-),score=210.81 GILI01003031.1:532-3222(-)